MKGAFYLSTIEQRQRLAILIDKVLRGDVDPETAVKITQEWTDVPPGDKPMDRAWHTLLHFQIDADIRQKDREYDERLRQALSRLSEELKSAS